MGAMSDMAIRIAAILGSADTIGRIVPNWYAGRVLLAGVELDQSPENLALTREADPLGMVRAFQVDRVSLERDPNFWGYVQHLGGDLIRRDPAHREGVALSQIDAISACRTQVSKYESLLAFGRWLDAEGCFPGMTAHDLIESLRRDEGDVVVEQRQWRDGEAVWLNEGGGHRMATAIYRNARDGDGIHLDALVRRVRLEPGVRDQLRSLVTLVPYRRRSGAVESERALRERGGIEVATITIGGPGSWGFLALRRDRGDRAVIDAITANHWRRIDW